MPPPTLASITISDNLINEFERPTVTFTFSEAVRNFDLSDVTAFGGFLDVLEPTGVNSPVWTARFNPFPNTDQDNLFIRVNLAGLQSASDNTSGAGTFDSVQHYSVDTIRPAVVSMTTSDNFLRIGETATVTVVFNEPCFLFPSGLLAQGGTFSNVDTTDQITWTATLTPNANTSVSTIMAVANMGPSDIAGNFLAPTFPGPNYTIDTTRPTLTITMDDTSLRAGETATVTFTFNEAVTGFDFNDIAAFGIAGSLTPPVNLNGQAVYTASITPFTDVEDADNIFSVDMSGVTGFSSGNPGQGLVPSPSFAVDTRRPTVSVGISDTNLGIGQTGAVTFTFSEAVTGFTNSDVSFANGALSTVASADGGVNWTATFTPTPGVTAAGQITVDATDVTDLAGNAGAGVANVGYSLDAARPTLLSVNLPNPGLSLGAPMVVEFVFSEPITGFTAEDVTFPNARLSAPVSSDGITWLAALQPPLTAVEDASNALSVNLAGVQDLAGSAGVGTGTSGNYFVDTMRPDVAITFSDTALAVGQTAVVTFAFTETVTGFDSADVQVENGTLTTPVTSDGGRTWTATYTPNVGLDDATNVVQVARQGVADLAGNSGLGFKSSPNFVLDSTAPTATIAISDTDLRDGDTATITVTFSEPVAPFTLSTPNGTIGAFAVSNGGATYTATYTPNFSVSDDTNLVTFGGAVRDVAGNLLTGPAVESANFKVHTSGPPDEGPADEGPPPVSPPLPPPSPPAPPPSPPIGGGVVALSGSENSDNITGAAEPNRVAGGDGRDSISGDLGDDTLSGDAGDDALQGNQGLDSISGGTGDDTLHGGRDADMVQGGADNDVVFGDLGNDTVHGGQGDDLVIGGDGDDYVSGDKGSDTLTGGAGADVFHSSGACGLDFVTDFDRAEGDIVRLDAGSVFTTAQVGADAVITIQGGGQLVLAGVQLPSLPDGWILAG